MSENKSDVFCEHCCASCKYFGYENVELYNSVDFWCLKKVWEDAEIINTIFKENNCFCFEELI